MWRLWVFRGWGSSPLVADELCVSTHQHLRTRRVPGLERTARLFHRASVSVSVRMHTTRGEAKMRPPRESLSSRSAITTTFSLLAAVAIVTVGCGSSSKSAVSSSSTSSSVAGTGTTVTGTAKAATGSPIKIGFIYSASGGASSSYVDSQYGAEARFDQQNAEGGI